MAADPRQSESADAPPRLSTAGGEGRHHAAHAAHGPGEHAEPGGHRAHEVDHAGHEQLFRRRFWVCLALSPPVLYLSPAFQDWFGYEAPAFGGSDWVAPAFAVAVFAYGGVPFLRMAWPEVLGRRPGMMTLISLAISVAFGYSMATLFISGAEGFFWELVTLIDIMLLGHWIEMRSVRQASGALTELARLLPDTAERVEPGGGVEEVEVAALRAGDLVLVRPGAGVPADGAVEEGISEVNEAMLTGESTPVEKAPGAAVIAGSINGDGSLRVRVTATGDGTALAGIMRLVDEAQRSRSRTQLLADRAAGWLFYLAVATAAVTAVAWSLAGATGSEIVSRVATVLVIACPHALGLAIPLVVALVTSIGARGGRLVGGRAARGGARRIDVVVFDKTGTLTRGEFRVAGLAVADGQDEDEALALAAAIEADSEHPIALGIRRSATERGVRTATVTAFEAMKGRGVRARAGDAELLLGGPRLLEMLEVEPDGWAGPLEAVSRDRGQTLVYLVRDGRLTAVFALADVVRPESRAAVEELHGMGIEVAMLTGDAEQVAASVAAELGIDRFFAEVLPEHKDRDIVELQRAGRRVAMVGDGVNDAPALARADLGVAIGGGTDVAVESADVVLVRNDPRDVPAIVRLSRAGYRKMVQNLVWASGYNVVALPLAAGVLAPFGILLSPAVGAVLMSVSTVIVAANAQLLRRTTI
jgi:Cu2+-exporting ATPase